MTLRLVTLETFDQSDEGTWPDQQKDNDKDNHKDKDNEKDIDNDNWRTSSKNNPRDLWALSLNVWDTDYISDNWEQ